MTIKFFACGDIVNASGNRDFIDDSMRNIISNCDIAICNFEAPIGNSEYLPIPKAGPHLYQHKNSIKHIQDAGFDFVSLANNHIYDYGENALIETINSLEQKKIEFIGAGRTFDEAYSYRIIDKKGVKIGLLAACDNEFGCLPENQTRGGYGWLFHPSIEDNIRLLKGQVDIIILIAHAGLEYVNFPLKEWRDRYKRLCDVGVNVILGHHPHVPQGYEKHNQSMIFYSLGNFYFDNNLPTKKTDDSYSIVLEITPSGLLGFEIIYHKKIQGTTTAVNKSDVDFSIEQLNSYLGEGYTSRNEQVCLEVYKKYYLSYYQNAIGFGMRNRGIKSNIKRILIKLLLNKKYKNEQNLLLLHNIKIDTHRFVVQRALSLLSQERN
jgi:poly-gamma-glutamate capsule biosynthesis protein CapA/YwtB (metallophosphatase superfamily)